MSQAEPNNPAGRILVVLEAASAMRGGSVRTTCAAALGVDNGDLGELLRMLGILSRQCDEVDMLLSGLSNPTYCAKYRESMPGIKKCFEVESVSGPWDAFKNNIVKPELLMALTFCSIALGESHGEKTVPQDELQKWFEKATKLYEEVRNSSLDPNLKSLILCSLERIRSAIREYKVRGIRAIREAIVDTVGNVSPEMDAKIGAEVGREKKSGEESPKIVMEWIGLAANIAQIVMFCMALSPLFAPVLRPLLSGQ